MTPEQARFLLDFTLPTLERETATTAKVLGATPNANLDYRPSERCMPAGELLWHIASSDVMFLEGILNGAFGKSPEKPADVTTPEQISAWYSRNMSGAIEKLSAYTPEEAAQSPRFLWVFAGAGGRDSQLRYGSQRSPSRSVVILHSPYGWEGAFHLWTERG